MATKRGKSGFITLAEVAAKYGAKLDAEERARTGVAVERGHALWREANMAPPQWWLDWVALCAREGYCP